MTSNTKDGFFPLTTCIDLKKNAAKLRFGKNMDKFCRKSIQDSAGLGSGIMSCANCAFSKTNIDGEDTEIKCLEKAFNKNTTYYNSDDFDKNSTQKGCLCNSIKAGHNSGYCPNGSCGLANEFGLSNECEPHFGYNLEQFQSEYQPTVTHCVSTPKILYWRYFPGVAI